MPEPGSLYPEEFDAWYVGYAINNGENALSKPVAYAYWLNTPEGKNYLGGDYDVSRDKSRIVNNVNPKFQAVMEASAASDSPPPVSEINWSPSFKSYSPLKVTAIIGGKKQVEATVGEDRLIADRRYDGLSPERADTLAKLNFTNNYNDKLYYGLKFLGQGLSERVGGYRDSLQNAMTAQGIPQDWSKAGADVMTGELLGVGVLSGVKSIGNFGKFGVQGSSKAVISNPLPVERIYARVMPEKFAKLLQEGKVKLSPNSDSWVTAAEDLKGITSTEEMAKKLTLIDKEGALRLNSNAVVEFRLKNPSGIASPINRADPGFVGGGRTAGGAREFIIPSDAEIEVIGIRILE